MRGNLTKLEQASFSPEQESIKEALANIDVEQLCREIKQLNFPRYLIDGAIDFARNGKVKILQIPDECWRDRQALEEMVAQIAENHIKEFYPPGWREPIRVTVGYVDFQLTKFLGGKLANALLSRKK